MKRVLLGMLLLASCGSEPLPASTEVVIPWQAPLECAAQTTVGGRLRATLKMASFNDCQLDVNPATLTASGRCDGIPTGTIRPIVLVYEQIQAASPTLPIAYWVGFVNLCEDALPPSGTEVPVQFVNDDQNGLLVYEPSQVDALPAPDPTAEPRCDDDLEDAKGWAKELILDSTYSLDVDCDGTANMVEACAESLYPVDTALCN